MIAEAYASTRQKGITRLSSLLWLDEAHSIEHGLQGYAQDVCGLVIIHPLSRYAQ